jgi:hypothetical protein
MTSLFHAAKAPLDENRPLPATPLDLSLISDEYKRQAEEFLLHYCPTGFPSRLSSWFAFDNPSHAAIYAKGEQHRSSQKANAPKLLYEVSLASFSRHPMVLAEAVAKLLYQGQEEHAIDAASEYCKPTREWKFWEFLSPELEVVGKLSWPEQVSMRAAHLTYQGDTEDCTTFLRELREKKSD